MRQTDSRFLDSSVWLGYALASSPQARGLIDSEEELFSSILSLYEVERRLVRLKIPPSRIAEFIEFMQNRSTIQGLDPLTVKTGVALSLRFSLGAFDALLLASAKKTGSVFVTADFDFKGVPGVELIPLTS